jgi:thiaminase/transcriptional activator TenA
MTTPATNVSLGERLVAANRATWTAMAAHPLVTGLADATIPEPALQAWVRQDRLFVLAERRVVAAMRAHGLPSTLDALLAGLDDSLVAEAEMFAAFADLRGWSAEAEPWPACLGYTSFLLATARDGLLDGLVALYGAERAYLDTWTAVAASSPPGSPFADWIANWSGPGFRDFVTALGAELDALAGTPGPALEARLGAVFTNAARFELAFWEMCWRAEGWPS